MLGERSRSDTEYLYQLGRIRAKRDKFRVRPPGFLPIKFRDSDHYPFRRPLKIRNRDIQSHGPGCTENQADERGNFLSAQP